MIDRLKNNKAFFIVCIILLILGIISIKNYIKDDIQFKNNYNEIYEKCQKNDDNEILCNNHYDTLKNRDTLSTFGYITIVYDTIYCLQLLAPLLVIIASTWNFHKYLRKGYLVNSISRIGYKKSIKNLYLNAIKGALIIPGFLFIIFIISLILSRNFDYTYGIAKYGFDAYGVNNYQIWYIFIPIYLLNFALHSIFWINISILNCSHNKNIIINIIISYIEYLMIFLIFELVFVGIIFANTKYMLYFNLTNIWAYTDVSLSGMVLISLLLSMGSTFIVYLTYKNKEKILNELEK